MNARAHLKQALSHSLEPLTTSMLPLIAPIEEQMLMGPDGTLTLRFMLAEKIDSTGPTPKFVEMWSVQALKEQSIPTTYPVGKAAFGSGRSALHQVLSTHPALLKQLAADFPTFKFTLGQPQPGAPDQEIAFDFRPSTEQPPASGLLIELKRLIGDVGGGPAFVLSRSSSCVVVNGASCMRTDYRLSGKSNNTDEYLKPILVDTSIAETAFLAGQSPIFELFARNLDLLETASETFSEFRAILNRADFADSIGENFPSGRKPHP